MVGEYPMKEFKLSSFNSFDVYHHEDLTVSLVEGCVVGYFTEWENIITNLSDEIEIRHEDKHLSSIELLERYGNYKSCDEFGCNQTEGICDDCYSTFNEAIKKFVDCADIGKQFSWRVDLMFSEIGIIERVK